jgi:hypothetical protein
MKLTEKLAQKDVDRLEGLLDKLFKSLNIDIEFTRHFVDRVNDSRNGEDITTAELAELFGATYKKYGKQLSNLNDDTQAVLNDIRSDINIPFVIDFNKKSGMLELISKTVMRKKNFKTSNKKYKVGEMKLTERLHRCVQFLNEKLIIVNKNKKAGQVLFLAGGAGCYPEGTEFMTPEGWKNIEDFNNDKVLQYDKETGKTNFVDPIEYYNLPTTKMYTIENRGVKFTTSIEHKHLLINEKTKNKEVMTTAQLLEKHDNLVRGNKKSLINTFDYSGSGLDITDDQVRLKVAIYADGHFLPRVSDQIKCRFRFKKDRKIVRAKYLLNRNNIDFKEYVEQDYNGRAGDYTVMEFEYDSKEKEFGSYWYKANNHQLEVITDEVLNWDGSIVERDTRVDVVSFSSNSKKSADFIQFAFASTGVKSNIYADNRYENTNYNVSVSQRNTTSGISKNDRTENTTTINEVSYDANMYCFQVPTGFFVVRQNDKIFVSGNSGKGFSQDKFIDVSNYKVFDVDALKSRLIKIAKKTGKNPELANLDLRKPEDVFALHKYVDDNKLADKQFLTFLNQAKKQKDLPNMLFDVTLKNIRKIKDKMLPLISIGYEPVNTHLIWVLADYKVAVIQNQERSRVVPADIVFQSHAGAAVSMHNIISGNIPDELDGEIYILLSGKDDTEIYVDNETGKAKTGISAITGRETLVIKDFSYIKVKDAGKPVKSDKEIQKQVHDWAKTRVPKEVRDLFN